MKKNIFSVWNNQIKQHSFNIFIGLCLITIVGGFFYFQAKNQEDINNQEIPQTALQMDMNNYLDYSDPVLANAQQNGLPILFFAATTWCQTCSALEEEILDRQSEIPSNATILKVDYDNDAAMKQKWDVTAQHTLIILDENGQEVKRWLGGGFDTLLQQMETI